MLMVRMLIKVLLCLGAHAQMRAYSSLVVFLSVTGISVPPVKFKS